jgi:hypothetical protein
MSCGEGSSQRGKETNHTCPWEKMDSALKPNSYPSRGLERERDRAIESCAVKYVSGLHVGKFPGGWTG